MNNQIKLANTWTHFYENLQGCDESNMYLTKILGLSDLLLNGTHCFMQLVNEGDLTLLLVAPDLESLQLFHQPKNLGGNQANPNFCCIALLRFDNVATPIMINTSNNIIHVLSPMWDLLCHALDNIEGLFSTLAPKEALNIENTIGLLFLLTQAYLDSTGKDSESLCKAFYSAMQEYDLQHARDDNREMFLKCFKHLIKFCWAASK